MGRRTTAAVLAGVAVLGLAACGAPGAPSRAADVSGVVEIAADTAVAVLTDASDPYFEGMSLELGDPAVVDADGATATLLDGDRVEVWVDDGCMESSPVQCYLAAIRVLD